MWCSCLLCIMEYRRSSCEYSLYHSSLALYHSLTAGLPLSHCPHGRQLCCPDSDSNRARKRRKVETGEAPGCKTRNVEHLQKSSGVLGCYNLRRGMVYTTSGMISVTRILYGSGYRSEERRV